RLDVERILSTHIGQNALDVLLGSFLHWSIPSKPLLPGHWGPKVVGSRYPNDVLRQYPWTDAYLTPSRRGSPGHRAYRAARGRGGRRARLIPIRRAALSPPAPRERRDLPRSEEHTSELQSPYDLVCRLLLEKKKNNK